MKRRSVLRTVGVGVLGSLAGCFGGAGGGSPTATPTPTATSTPTETETSTAAPVEHPGTLDQTFATNGDYPPDDDPADGRPPTFAEQPSAPTADASSFETLDVNDESVALAPIEVVEAWYRRGEARFVDARGMGQYTRAHVYGAVLSPAQPESRGGPIDGWPTDERVVTYCTCPHHLSSVRAAGLQKAGFTDVYAIDDGFGEWFDLGHPMAGTEFGDGTRAAVSEWTVAGSVDASHAGEYVWAAADRQYEAAPIRADGGFELSIRFWDVTPDTPVRVSTPAYTVTRPLGELADGGLETV